MSDATVPATASDTGTAQLFGRGFAFTIVWSMQLVAATVVSPVLAHLLPPVQFGQLTIALASYQLVMIGSVLGLDQAIELQRIEDGADDRRARGVLAAAVVLALVACGVWAVGVPVWSGGLGFGRAPDLALLTLAWAAPGSVVLSVLSLLQAEDRLRRFTVVSLLSTVGGQVTGLALLMLRPHTATTYVLGCTIAQLVAAAVGLAWTRPRWRGLTDRTTLRRALVLGLPLAFAWLGEFTLTIADRFVIERWLGHAEVARYQIAFVLGSAATLVLTFVNRSWQPRLKEVADEDARWRLVTDARDGILVLVGYALLGLTVGAPAVLRVVAPPSYDVAGLSPIVFVMALAAIPAAVAGTTSVMLVTVRRSAPAAWATALAVGVKAVLTVASIGPLGLFGVALGTAGAYLARAGWLHRAASRDFPPRAPSATTARVLAGTVAVAAVSLWLPQTPAWNIGRFAVAVACLVPFARALRRLQQPAG